MRSVRAPGIASRNPAGFRDESCRAAATAARLASSSESSGNSTRNAPSATSTIRKALFPLNPKSKIRNPKSLLPPPQKVDRDPAHHERVPLPCRLRIAAQQDHDQRRAEEGVEKR